MLRKVMRQVSIFGALTLVTASVAQTLGTKADPMVMNPTSSGGGGVMPIVQLGIAIAIIVGALKFGLPKLVPMLSKKLHPSLGSTIRVEESATFAGGTLYVVEAKGKSLLLCASASGVACLADLTEPTGTTREEPPAFFEVLDHAKSDPTVATRAVVEVADLPTEPTAKPQPSQAQVQLALERLARLTR